MLHTEVPALQSFEEAGARILARACDPTHWGLMVRRVSADNRARVGHVQVCATIDITPTLDTYLRVSFKGPRLSPMDAAGFLEEVLSVRFLFMPNAEWFVEIDARRWIHFSHRYTQPRMEA